MQTEFTLHQLDDPVIAEADSILRRCVHCGFCTATCPTYVLLGDERDSPRGRIYLMKEMFEQNTVTPATVRHIDRCLSCLSCMTTCPSDVDYMHLVDLARARIAATYRRPLADRLRRRLLGKVLPDRHLFRLAMLFGWAARPLAPVLKGIGLKRMAAALALLPANAPALKMPSRNPIEKAERRAVRRVGLLLGCVQDVLRNDINSAAIRLLKRHGVEVVILDDQACCGALNHHMGQEEAAFARIRQNIDAWSAVMRQTPLDAIVTTASGCGTMVKDYGYLLAGDQGYAARAIEIAHRTMDICEFIAEIGLTAPVIWSELEIAYHAPCSLQHGQGIGDIPRQLLDQAGFRVKDLPENHLCCGSAGSYSLLQPEISQSLGARKRHLINQISPDIVATGNIGCLTQLKAGETLPIVHTVELLDWATGGPCPGLIKPLKAKAKPVRTLIESGAS